MTASGNCFAEYKHIIFLVSTLEPAHLVIAHPPSPQEKAHSPALRPAPFWTRLQELGTELPSCKHFLVDSLLLPFGPGESSVTLDGSILNVFY